MVVKTWQILLILSYFVAFVSSRIHKLLLSDDERPYIDLSTFGYYRCGILDVQVINFKLPTGTVEGQYGFTLDRTVNDAISPYLESHTESCFLKQSHNLNHSLISSKHPVIIFLKMDFTNLKLDITCEGESHQYPQNFYQNRNYVPKGCDSMESPQFPFDNRRRRSPLEPSKVTDKSQCSYAVLPMTKTTRNNFDYYNISFAMHIATNDEEGLYNLYFHNCPNIKKNYSPAMNFMIELYESNGENFLSAGDMPLPALYSMMSLIFFLCGGFWTFILRSSKYPVYRIHIIMCVLVYLKALSLAFHAVNYHFIQTRGEHVTAWAILYYITHLLKGAVLFVTLVLVGTGWNFIKHILADRDKKLFMIVIPLQVIANVAEIIIAESNVGAAEYNAWRDLFIMVDLLCCGAIMCPVVWSIRHLQDASSTDGKAAINLRKLKLFRHFYIMILCYIYFTRIIVCIIKVRVPFQYSWVDEMFREMVTFVFFVTTGYKFRPASANPYFTPNADDVETKVLSEIGVLEGVKVRGDRRKEDAQPLMEENYESD